MEVTKVKVSRNFEFFNQVYIKGSVFYVTDTYRPDGSTANQFKIFNAEFKHLGNLGGAWFDFGNKDLFYELN